MWRAASAFLPRVSRLCLQASAPKQIDPYVCALAACDVLLQDRSRVWSRWLPYVAAALALPQAAHMKGDEADESYRWQFLGLTSRRRVFFKYEKRIRELSAPDKVFDYFASVSQSGSRLMTPADLLHSLVAVYPPENSKLERSGALKGDRHDMSAQLPEMIKESDFFQQFDTDGDGFISFGEYLLIVTFLAIPLEDVHTIFSMFDDDDSGAISLAEFLHVTNSLQKRLRRVSRIQRTGLAANVGKEGHGMLISFFGPDGKGQLDLTHFRDFCIALHAELVRLEFLHYDDAKKGYIPGISFAHSLVSHTHMQEVDAYLTAVDSMPADLKNARVSWGDFKSFALLRQSVHRLAVALDFFFSTEGKICKHDFQHAVSKILGQGLPSILVDIIFSVYATEEGHLNYREFLYAIRRREGNNLYSKQMLGLDPTSKQSIFACLWSCILLED